MSLPPFRIVFSPLAGNLDIFSNAMRKQSPVSVVFADGFNVFLAVFRNGFLYTILAFGRVAFVKMAGIFYEFARLAVSEFCHSYTLKRQVVVHIAVVFLGRRLLFLLVLRLVGRHGGIPFAPF